jgi:hypothetical protein
VTNLPDLDRLSHGEKDALIRALWAQVHALTARIAELEARLGGPPKNSDNSSQPPSRDQKTNQPAKPKREGPRKGSIGRTGGGRLLAENPDETVIARPLCCARCQAGFAAADHRLIDRFDKIELPKVVPVVTRVLDAVMALAPATKDGKRLRKRYRQHRAHLFTFLDHPEVAPDNNSSERELRPTATYRKVTGGFRSDWGADLFAACRSIVGTAARRGIGAYDAIKMTLQGNSVIAPG